MTDAETYAQFTTSIPVDKIKVAPKCNCTCQLSLKLKRRRCFYENDDIHVDDSDEVIEIDLDQLLEDKKSKNCSLKRYIAHIYEKFDKFFKREIPSFKQKRFFSKLILQETKW